MLTGTRPPIPPFAAKLVFSGTTQTHQWRTISYAELAGTGITSADLNTLATTINTAWGTRFTPVINQTTLLTGVQILYVPSVGSELQGISTVTKTGLETGSPVASAGASFVVNWNVNRYYRGGHPRWYLPGVQLADVTNGSQVGGTIRTSLATAANGFLNDVNGATTTHISSITLGTLSFQSGNAWRVPPVFWAYVGASVSPILGSQRRRIHS